MGGRFFMKQIKPFLSFDDQIERLRTHGYNIEYQPEINLRHIGFPQNCKEMLIKTLVPGTSFSATGN
jgi:hypothetical protein